MKNKRYSLELIKAKINGERNITFQEIANLTDYSKRQIINFSKEIKIRILILCSFMLALENLLTTLPVTRKYDI